MASTPDPPRLLARRSELAYVPSSTQALTGEPEAVSEHDHKSCPRAHARDLQTWVTSRDRILGNVAHLRAQLHDPGMVRFCRAMERQVAAEDRKRRGRV